MNTNKTTFAIRYAFLLVPLFATIGPFSHGGEVHYMSTSLQAPAPILQNVANNQSERLAQGENSSDRMQNSKNYARQGENPLAANARQVA